MLERLYEKAAKARNHKAAQEYQHGRDIFLEKTRKQMFEETAEEVRVENRLLLGGLGEIDSQLDIPGIVSELSEGIRLLPSYPDAQAQAESFSWMIHPPRMVKKDFSVAGGLRALRGWRIGWTSPDEDRQAPPELTVLLYQQKAEGALLAEEPRLAVVPLKRVAEEDSTIDSIDKLLFDQSKMSFIYKDLVRIAQVGYEGLTNQHCGLFIAMTRGLEMGVRQWSRRGEEYEWCERTVEHELGGRLKWTQEEGSENRRPHNKLADAYHGESKYIIDRVGKKLRSGEIRFINPDLLSDDETIWESLNLPTLNALFASPRARRLRGTIPGGPIGEHSWQVLATDPMSLDLQRQEIAKRLEDYCLQDVPSDTS